MDFSQWWGVGSFPIVIQFTNWAKSIGIPSKFAPLASIAFGILLNLIVAVIIGQTWQMAVGVGFVAGFVASGWYDLTK